MPKFTQKTFSKKFQEKGQKPLYKFNIHRTQEHNATQASNTTRKKRGQTMNATKTLRNAANKITAKYSRWSLPGEFVKLYDELGKLGITTGLLTGDNHNPDPAPWYVDGERVENSLFCLSMYNGGNSPRNEYNCYFS